MLNGVTESTKPADNAATAGPRTAAFFDLDRAIIAKSGTLAFSKPFFQEGLINRRAVLKSAYAQFLFMLAGADEDQVDRMRAHIVSLCTGWDVEQINAIVEETLHDIVDPLVYKEATQLVEEHKEQGQDVVVLSASGQEMVGPIADILGATHSAGSRMAVADGRYTGEVEFHCSAGNKARAAQDIAERYGYDLTGSHAYSDSVVDLPLLESVGHPTAVNPDRGLRKEAAQRGWPSLAFEHPVSLRACVPTPSGTAVTAAAVGAGAVAAAGVTWFGLRHWRRRR
ncbi:HAD superfamily hydrolase (TIGR01490 family) [Halopolyspora algeriensis]|uniref:HAD superfamily hydrolase (TIGR01490 family) n=1 Tax=Halopolyspora algeriensis TaxID=1500506 RepID=A0A368VKM2_9ACTN|nr:HAD-IB family hydrolase [Halopolyspora algeriensis]RCW40203.1 HAD superfamily hydrolase (TIGR01490 family) [Halopolyspora algeriensis]TQM46315.1 HAD superfamily hydrolase (TIGR01490 family) [Halopolyspora algeriensis]